MDTRQPPAAPARPRLLDQVRDANKDVSTTMIYTHVLNKGGRGVKSPLDSGGAGAPPVARDVAVEYSVSVRAG